MDEPFPFPFPQIEKSELVYQEFVSVRRDSLRYHTGHRHHYYTLDIANHAVSIVATTSDEKFLLNREYRHSNGKVILSCPGGLLSENEDPLDGAARELLEETGHTADSFRIIGKAPPLPGLCSQNILFVHAHRIKKVAEPALEPSELLSPTFMTLDEIYQYIRQGKDVDGILCSSLFFYHLQRQQSI